MSHKKVIIPTNLMKVFISLPDMIYCLFVKIVSQLTFTGIFPLEVEYLDNERGRLHEIDHFEKFNFYPFGLFFSHMNAPS